MSAALHDAAVLEELTAELARMRGAKSMGAQPPLDIDGPMTGGTDGAGGGQADEGMDGAVEEALLRMQDQVLSAQRVQARCERESLQTQLSSRDHTRSAERDDLAQYLDALRGRDDETGDALRSSAFATEVDQLARRDRSQRSEDTAAAASGGVASGVGGLSHALQAVDDPATFEALLEVQRLDEAIASCGASGGSGGGGSAGAAGNVAGAGSHGPTGVAAAAAPAPSHRRRPQSQPARAAATSAAGQPLLPAPSAPVTSAVAVASAGGGGGGGAPTFLTSAAAEGGPTPRSPKGAAGGGGGGDAVAALSKEIERLKTINATAIDGLASSSSLSISSNSSKATARAAAAAAADGGFTVGGRRCVGGVWMSVADDERATALLAESSALRELEGGDGAASPDGWESDACPEGEGYRPDAADAERLRAIDAALEALQIDHELASGEGAALAVEGGALAEGWASGGSALGGGSSQLSKRSAADGGGGGGGEYLTAMRQERADAAALERVRDRLAELHHKPSHAVAESSAEREALAALLSGVRAEAECAVDARGGGLRPTSARGGGGGGGGGAVDALDGGAGAACVA